MGYSSRAENILLCLGALGNELGRAGHPVDLGVALSAAGALLDP
jgi:alanine-glyoxylate transaminase/serine-glyoxylate transaminase/serine-pyruvate transaminase